MAISCVSGDYSTLEEHKQRHRYKRTDRERMLTEIYIMTYGNKY